MPRFDLERIEEVVEELESLDWEERERYLKRLRASEPELCEEVLRFVNPTGDDFLEDSGERMWSALGVSDDPVGETIGHYRIEEVIGRGGMGVVYRATDVRLNRQVALKFLPEGLRSNDRSRERFLREARSVARLDHPNVCAIYAVEETDEGVPVIAMALYEGRTLRQRLAEGPLENDEVESIVEQTAAGLHAAHGKGLIHRDIKPDNLFLTDDGTIKILDFGIASAKNEQTITHGRGPFGTIAYMSPEQTRGESTTERSDIWAIGAVAYELVTGRSPFDTDKVETTIHRIRHEDPMPLPADTPKILAETIETCLAKAPEARFESAGAIVERLRGARTRSRMPARMWAAAVLAVVLALIAGWWVRVFTSEIERLTRSRGTDVMLMPVEMAGAPDDVAAVAGGLYEDLAFLLGEIDGVALRRGEQTGGDLKMYLKREDADLALVMRVSGDSTGSELHAVISDDNSDSLWSQSFFLTIENAQDVRDRILESIALEIEIDREVARGPRETHSVPAYEHYLRGLNLLKGRFELEEAAKSFSAAYTEDPTYASAYAAYSQALALKASTGYLLDPDPDKFETARIAAERALAIDAKNSFANLAMGMVLHDFDWEWEEGRYYYKKAIELNRGYAEGYHLMATHYAKMDRLGDAIEFQRTARIRDPTVPIYFANLLQMYWMDDRLDTLFDELELMSDSFVLYPMSQVWIGYARMDREQYEEAERAIGIAEEGMGEDQPLLVAMRARLLAKQGRGVEAIALAESIADIAPTLAANAYIILEQGTRALDLLYQAKADRDVYLPFVNVWPDSRLLRDSTRFQQLLDALDL